ncbi:MAG: glycosyltransferase [Patescibacteria group bacterium]
MKILQVNNYHYRRGGAEACYFDTAELLKKGGHEVAHFSMHHPKNQQGAWNGYFADNSDFNNKYSFVDKTKAVGRIFYNREAKKKIRKLIKEFRPDIAHLHNIYHHLSPSIIDELKKQGVPTVMTLHDYKLICPNYNLFAHGEIWERNKKHKYYRCFLDKCVKDSYAKSLVCTAEAYLHYFLGIYQKADAFISPSRFLIDKFEKFGFNKKIYHLPNPILEQDTLPIKEEKKSERYILYFGRLSREKGLKELIEAYGIFIKRAGEKDIKLKITGDGPQKEELEKLVQEKGLEDRVVFTGRKEKEDLREIVKEAMIAVFPFKWYENYPYSILEAQQAGKAVISSDLGGANELIKNGYNGFLYTAGNVEELSVLMEKLAFDPLLRKEAGEKAQRTVAQRNDKDNFYEQLISIYNKFIF